MNKGGELFQSRQSKVVLGVIVAILLVVGIVLYANSRSGQQTVVSPTATPTKVALGTPRYTGELPSGQTVTATPKTKATARPVGPVGVTPIVVSTRSATTEPTAVASKSVIIGDLDWSKNLTAVPEKKLDISTQDALDKFKKNPNICTFIGVQDSWSNPFEKTLCGMMQFINDQIIVPLVELDCQMYSSYLAMNYDSNITSSIVNGLCQIEDRK